MAKRKRKKAEKSIDDVSPAEFYERLADAVEQLGYGGAALIELWARKEIEHTLREPGVKKLKQLAAEKKRVEDPVAFAKYLRELAVDLKKQNAKWQWRTRGG